MPAATFFANYCAAQSADVSCLAEEMEYKLLKEKKATLHISVVSD